MNIVMAGLIFQIITLSMFYGFFADYMIRFLHSTHGIDLIARDDQFFGFLILSVLLNLARCIFRACELKEGYKGDTIGHEGLCIDLEGVWVVHGRPQMGTLLLIYRRLVLGAVFCLCIGHPEFVFTGRQGRSRYVDPEVMSTVDIIIMEMSITAYHGSSGEEA